MYKVLLANITWNPFGWKNTYVNPKAGHSYARENVAHESLNFKFDKEGIDTTKYFKGYVQWRFSPLRFVNGGLVIFYTWNTDNNQGQIVGIYGKTEILKDKETYRKKGFTDDEYVVNLRADKQFSILFPIPLLAKNYRNRLNDRIVGQIGFTYKDIPFAKKVLSDEIVELSRSGILESDLKKLISIYEYYVSQKFKSAITNTDEIEQNELEEIYNKKNEMAKILHDLRNLTDTDPEEVEIHHKMYKRDNKTIVQLKILRNFKCQICGTTIIKKNGKKYIEASHIKPKSKKGNEIPSNILILCPNHHKEFDYGDLLIKKYSKTIIELVLNKKLYKINLSLN